jgi:uncharacterized protein Yka (UPF0111/DUF47 family)
MNIDKVLKFFVPKDHSFHPLFEEDSRNLVKAAELLRKQMSISDTEVHEKIHKEIKEVEHIGDDITDKTFQLLNKSFITPFDREDIHELTANIDDVVDSIDSISRRICLYKPKNLMPVYKEMSELIYAAAIEINTCIHLLVDAAANKKEITAACNTVKEIEHKSDELYYVAVAEIFEKEKDTAELMKNNKIVELLERTVDEEEDVTDTVRSILIKMA